MQSPIEGVPGSMVAWAQKRLLDATHTALAAIAADVRDGLAQTTGVGATWVDGEQRASVVLDLSEKDLPPGVTLEIVARAIDLENIEAWCDTEGRVRVGINVWNSIKDTDQTVLAVTKVTHVLLGMHATDTEPHTHG